MTYSLPKTVYVNGREWVIRSDFRPILEICCALNDPELDGQEKAEVLLRIFYPEFDNMPPGDYQEAVEQCFWFINCGDNERNQRPAPKIMDWDQDFRYIVAPVNRVLGREIREIPYDYAKNIGGLHWWSFISAYYEIGDCLFAQIIRIRDLLARGKTLDKTDQEWYRRNRSLVDIKSTITDAEQSVMDVWMGKT